MEDDELWEYLCKFLSIEPVPNIQFPHSNAAPVKAESVDVVIPYIDDEEDWEPLRYSLRALEKNFIDLGKIFMIGDIPPWIKGVYQVPWSMAHSMDQRTRNFSFCHSMWIAAKVPEISDSFLYMADDHYILTPRTAQDFRDTVLVRENMETYTQRERRTGRREWQQMIWHTVDKLMDGGYSGWNYETHTPKMIEKTKLMDCFAMFGIGDGKLIWQTAYFNMHPPSSEFKAYLCEESGLRAGIYREMTVPEIEAAARDAVFLNHNDDGVNDALRDYLESRFPEPSRFEQG